MGKQSHKLPNKDFLLWSRGGLNDVTIEGNNPDNENIKIEIPDTLIYDLYGETKRAKLIAIIEEMDEDAVRNCKLVY